MESEDRQRLLHYEIIERVGESPVGQVYKARDTRQQRLVALKLLKRHVMETAAFRAPCLSAVKGLAGCSHPNICSVFGIHEADDSYAIVTEFVQGTTLRELIDQRPLDTRAFLDIAPQIADGINFAHERLVTHGNIKPSNVFVTGKGRVKIMDFGLSPYPAADPAAPGERPADTLHYLAPEQITGEPLTQLSDLFSLGVLFYEMLTGRRPFEGDTSRAVEDSILHDRADFGIMTAKKIPGDTILVIKKLLAKQPQERFSSARELSITLSAICSFESQSATRRFLQVQPQTPRQYLLISLLAFLLVALWYVVTTFHH